MRIQRGEGPLDDYEVSSLWCSEAQTAGCTAKW
jgi:hypothetical protein